MSQNTRKHSFQYFSSVPILNSLQAVLFIKIRTFLMNILYNTLGGNGKRYSKSV